MFAELPVWLRGLFLGLALSAPVGPIGLLCIRRTINRGPLSGLATGIGAASVDTFFAALAAFGISALIDILTDYSNELRLIGGIIMLVMSYSIWSDNTANDAANATPDDRTQANLLRSATSGFALTITNPITIIAVIALVTTFGAGGGPFTATMLVFGVFLGACSWWGFLCFVTTLFRDRFSAKTVPYINHITAIILSFFGIWVLGYTIGQLLPQPFGYYVKDLWPF